jgi:cell division protein ZapA
MSKVETVSLRIFGRDLTIACPPKEKDNLIKAANLLNEELDNISDKNNALIIAGLTLANKLLTGEPNNKSSSADEDFSKLIKKIEKTLEK